ncbi:MAG: flagellar hook capping FlgD N-terminal domain-containing protein [Pseudomonadota bacterium]
MDPILNPPLLPASAQAAANQPTDRTAATADFNSFLQLLTAQLENQDPLQPLDSTQFVAQLASFSSVEQLVGVNERLDSLTASLGGNDTSAFVTWIGREASSIDGRFRADGAPLDIDVAPEPGANAAVVSLKRSDGTSVREITVPSGSGTVRWDGLTTSGATLNGTELTAEVTYLDTGGEIAKRAAQVYREVIGLRGGPGGVMIDLADGTTLSPERITGVRK